MNHPRRSLGDPRGAAERMSLFSVFAVNLLLPATLLSAAAHMLSSARTMVVYLIQKMADSTAADMAELRGATSERAPQQNDKRPPDIAGGANWNTEEA